MTFFPSLPDDAHVAHLFSRYPHVYKLYTMASRAIMRGPSPLSFKQRETIGAFVSALNGCEFCYGAHSQTASLFGMDPRTLSALVKDIETAPIPENEKPLFKFAKKLTETPSRMVARDAQIILDAGWDEDALHSVTAIVCTFSFMNRIAPAMGIDPERQDFEMLGEERRNTDWVPMVPIEASKIADTPDQAYERSPPNWARIWNL